MRKQAQGECSDSHQLQVQMIGLLREPLPERHWVTGRQPKVWRPPTDVYETDDSVVVKVEIAGMQEGDFSLSMEAQTLTIAGVRHDPTAKLAYQQMEILYGQFESIVLLPHSVNQDKIEATYQNGFLNVVLPKARPRQVPITSS